MKNKRKLTLNLFIVFTIVCAILCFVKIKYNKVNDIEEITISQNEKADRLVSDNEAHIMARTMTLIVNNIDEDGELIEESVNYSISAFNSNNVTNSSNPNGILSQTLNMPTSNGQFTIDLTQTKSANGYTSTVATKQITVEFEEVNGVMNITSCNCGEGLELISNNSISIKVKWLNNKIERAMIPIMFVNEDENGEELNGAIFTIKDNEMLKIVEIKKDGCVLVEIPSPAEAKTQKYKVEQITAADGYNKIKGESELYIKYELVNGQLTATEVYFTGVDSNKVKALHFTGILTQLTFVNSEKTEQEEEDDDDEVSKVWMTLVVNNKNSEGENLASGKFVFEDYEGIKQSCISDSNGVAVLEFISPNEPGLYTYKIEQVVAANGYNEINGKFELIISYKLVDGKIVLDSANIDVVDGIGVSAEITDNFVVEVTFVNEAQQEDTFERQLVSFMVSNENENGDALNGASFSIKSDDDNQQVGIIKDGVVLFQLLSPNKAGTQTYKVSQLSATEGYKMITGEMEFSVVYGVENGQIVIVDAAVNVVGSNNIIARNIDGVMVELVIINEEETQEESYDALTSFKIVNKNKNGDILEGATFYISFDDSDHFVEANIIKMISIKLGSLIEEKEYRIEQGKTAEGYNGINGNIKVIVEHEIVDNESKIKSARLSVIGNDNIQITVLNETVVEITIINEEDNSEEAGEEGEEETFNQELITFTISNKNTEGEFLNGATFRIISGEISEEVGIIEDGKVTFQLLSPNKVGEQVYLIEQLTAAEGYNIISGKMRFFIEYNVEDGKVRIIRADSGVAETEYIIVENTDGVTVGLTIVNDLKVDNDISKQLITIRFKNIGEDGELLSGANFKYGMGIIYNRITDENGEFSSSHLSNDFYPGTDMYDWSQETAAEGYCKINGKFKLIVIFEIVENKLEIVEAYTNAATQGVDGVEVEKIDSTELEVRVTNRKAKSVTLTVKNQNKDGEALSGSEFCVGNKTLATNENGEASFNVWVDPLETSKTCSVQQLSAISGYEQINGAFNVEILYKLVNDEIEIEDGSIMIVQDGEKSILIEKVSSTEIKVTVVNGVKTEIPKQVIKITFKNVGEDGEELSGAEFKFGMGIIYDHVTDENGEFSTWHLSNNMYPTTDYYDWSQEAAAEGYCKINGKFMLMVKYELVDNKLEIVDAVTNASAQGVDGVYLDKVDSTELVVRVINKKAKNVTLKIKNQNKDGEALSGAEFRIDNKTLATDENGEASFNVWVDPAKTKCVYGISQMSAVSGYNKINGIFDLEVIYELVDGVLGIADAASRVIQNGDVCIMIEKTSSTELLITVINSEQLEEDDEGELEENLVEQELITFTLRNENQNGEVISGSTFNLKSGNQIVNGVADENGEFTFKLLSPNKEKVEKYTIEQVSVADGYALIIGECEISVVYKVVEGKIVVVDAYSNMIGDYGLKVEDVNDDEVMVKFINLEKENENDPDVEIKTIPFKVITQDKEGNNIVESTEYIISELLDDGKKTYSAKSDNDGVLTVQVQMPVAAGVVRYSVQQVKQPNGYVQDTNEYEIQLEYQDNNGTISFVGAEALVECTYCLKVSNCTDTLIETIFVNKRVGEPVKLDVNGIDGAEIDGDFIDKIKVSTSLKDFVESLSVDGSIEVFDAKGNKIDLTDPSTENLKMGTGFKIQINEAGQIIEKEVIVVGDYNGDGIITISDVAAANKYLLGAIPYSEKLQKACDISGDGQITISDVAKLNKYYLGAIPQL